MLKALQGMFAGAEGPAPDDDERDASGKPRVTLAKALKRDWLEVWYQPKVSLQTGNMVGAEGLIRLRHPELGVLGPGAFLPGAGEVEMLEMTEQVIITALRDWSDCAALGMPAAIMSAISSWAAHVIPPSEPKAILTPAALSLARLRAWIPKNACALGSSLLSA